MKNKIKKKKNISNLKKKIDISFFIITEDIINNDEFKKRINYNHHNGKSVYEHSLQVSLYTYKITRFFKLNYIDATIGALIHDFYKEDWTKSNKKGIKNLHGLTHANEAYENCLNYLPSFMNKRTKNIIKRHMFPLNITPPLYIESWIVSLVDKFVSMEIFAELKESYKFIVFCIIFRVDR